MGQTVKPVDGWVPDTNIHAGYANSAVVPFEEFDYVWVEAWNCVVIVLEVIESCGSVRVTDRLSNRDGTARFDIFQFNEVEMAK